ncbi:hypothetical protein ASE49_17215 [Novosphingobium sp. Leaf2]|nr:hypothetical protein ASE49_17215 [Novosphingobium sp. Leaf2]
MSGGALAEAARRLIGTPFRLHGRDPEIGLDCVGVLAAALTAIGQPARLPTGYTLRCRTVPDVAAVAARIGMAAAGGTPQAGDVLLVRTGPCQLHLAIAITADTIVHAHAGLRKVVLSALPADWPTIAHLRMTGPLPLESN